MTEDQLYKTLTELGLNLEVTRSVSGEFDGTIYHRQIHNPRLRVAQRKSYKDCIDEFLSRSQEIEDMREIIHSRVITEETKAFPDGVELTIYRLAGHITQVMYKYPACTDESGKIRCPKGWTWLRLWEYNGIWTLSQGIKAALGSGDVPLFKLKGQPPNCKTPEDWVEFIFDIKGPELSLLEESYGSSDYIQNNKRMEKMVRM